MRHNFHKLVLRGKGQGSGAVPHPASTSLTGWNPRRLAAVRNFVEHTRHTWHMTRIPSAIAGLAILAVSVAACGSDDADGDTASDPNTASASASASASPSESPSDSPAASGAVTDSDVPVALPIINEAAKEAIKD